MTIRAYGARCARNSRSHYDVILIVMSFATELATPIVMDVRTYGHLASFIEIRSGVLEPPMIEIWSFPLLWLLAFSTASTQYNITVITIQPLFDTILVHGQVTIIFVVSVGLSVCLSVCLFVCLFVCLCRVFLRRL